MVESDNEFEMKQDEENNNNNLVYNYTSSSNLYGLSFQRNIDVRIAISSIEMDVKNKIEIVEFQREKLRRIHTEEIEFPCTKLMWSPSANNSSLLATSSDAMRIYSFNQDMNKLYLNTTLVKSKQYNAPITSFDWNVGNSSILGTSSIDTTCTIWDVNKSMIVKQIIAHDKDVYDISFSKKFENYFVTTGADGSIRGFDLRNLAESDVLFESQELTPLTRIAWNLQNEYFLSALCLEKNYFFIIDIRKKDEAYATLNTHTNVINAMAWSPKSNAHLCTVGDDKSAYIWDITEKNEDDPKMSYNSNNELNNVAWSESNSEWIGIVGSNQLQLLKV